MLYMRIKELIYFFNLYEHSKNLCNQNRIVGMDAVGQKGLFSLGFRSDLELLYTIVHFDG